MTDDQLRELGKQLPWDRPDPARRDALRSSLLVEASEGARPIVRRRWLLVGTAFATGALAAAAVALVLVRDDHTQVQLGDRDLAAQITASSEARLEHRVVATETGFDEVVHVHDGKVRLSVEPPRRGDHVRLRTRDAEVEGQGEYEVVVIAETLSAVSVRTGSAEIKVAGQRTVLLSAGQTWRASIITTDLSPTPLDRVAVSASIGGQPADTIVPPPDTVRIPDAVRPPDTRAPASAVRPADAVARSADTVVRPADAIVPAPARPTTIPTKPDPGDFADKVSGVQDADKRVREADKPIVVVDSVSGSGAGAGDRQPGPPTRTPSTIEKRFQAGWSLLKGGKAREAALELGAAADAAPNDPLAADARYFQAVALVRAGQRPEAERVLVKFLDTAPRSLRRGRAAVLLGRLIGDRGDLASARAWLESAASDADPTVASAAKAGLEALATKNKPSR
jgi:TolA-binding protein